MFMMAPMTNQMQPSDLQTAHLQSADWSSRPPNALRGGMIAATPDTRAGKSDFLASVRTLRLSQHNLSPPCLLYLLVAPGCLRRSGRPASVAAPLNTCRRVAKVVKVQSGSSQQANPRERCVAAAWAAERRLRRSCGVSSIQGGGRLLPPQPALGALYPQLRDSKKPPQPLRLVLFFFFFDCQTSWDAEMWASGASMWRDCAHC